MNELFQPIRVLLVEDNPGDARLLQEMLADSPLGPFDVTAVNRLGAALIRLQQEQFNLILLDLSLPDSEGLDTLSGLLVRSHDTPLIVMTGINDEGVGNEAIRLGAKGYLVKGGVDRDNLTHEIEKLVPAKAR